MMLVYIYVLCLLFIPAFTLTLEEYFYSTQKKYDNQYCPELSVKKDTYMCIGQQFQINCSLPLGNYKNNASQYLKTKCPIAVNQSIDGSINSNCSSVNQHINESTIHPGINSLTILHCTTDNHSSCIVQNTIQLNARTLSLIKPNLSVSDTGTYICQYNNSRKTEASLYLKIGYEPMGIDSGDISCVAMDLDNVNCSWNKSTFDVNNPFPVFYKAYFNSSPSYGWFDCPHPKSQSCSISSASSGGQKYSFNMLNNYTLYVNATVKWCGSQITKYSINLNETVKLSPPNITSVTRQERRITLLMNLLLKTKLALQFIKNIVYQVSYKSKYSNTINNFTSSEEQNISVILSKLIPFTTYTITIKSRGLKTKGTIYWSNPITRTYRTKPAAPTVVPHISSGGYSVNNGVIFIYLKPILQREKNSKHARYKVKIKKDFISIQHFNVSWENTTINATNLPRQFSYQIEVQTVNDIGESRNTRILQIPAYNPAKHIPINIVAERSKHDSYNVLWDKGNLTVADLDKIIVFWCHGVRQNYVCKSDLSWINLLNTQTSITVSGLADNVRGDWMFAVSYEYSDGYNTGMIFAECYFPSVSDAPLSIAPYNVIGVSTTSIQIKPLVYCSNVYSSRPMEFVVYYQETKVTLESCDETFLNISLNASLRTGEITLQNLIPSTTYTICLSVITKGGVKTDDAHVIQTLAVSKLMSVDAYIIVLAVIGSLVIISAAMFTFCKLRNKWNQPIEVVLPKIISKEYKKVTLIREEVPSKLDNISCNDSGLPSDDTYNTLSSSNSTIDKQQSHLVLNDKCRIDYESGHVVSKEIQSGKGIERNSMLDCDETTKLISSDKDRNSITSDLKIHGCIRNVTLKSSQTQCNDSQQCLWSEPKDKLILLTSHNSNIYRDNYLEQSEHSVLNEHSRSQENDASATLKISDENTKEEYVKQGICESIEDLEKHDSTLDQKKDYTRNNDSVQEYVRVDHDGSVKSNYQRQNNRYTQQDNSYYHRVTQPLIVQSKNSVQCRTLDESDNNEKTVVLIKEEKQNKCVNSSKTFSDDTINVSHSNMFNTKLIRNSEHVSIDVSLEKTIPSTHDENKTRQTQEDLEEFNTRSSFNSLTTENETSGDLCSGISDYLLVDQCDSSHCEQPDDDSI